MFEVTEVHRTRKQVTDTCDICGKELGFFCTNVIAQDDQGFERSAWLCNYCGDTIHVNTAFDSFGEFIEFIELRREELKPWIKVDTEE